MTKEIAKASSAIYATMMASVTPTCDPACVPVSTCDMARAAIASLLPPSEAMVEAAAQSLAEYNGDTENFSASAQFAKLYREQAREALTAAINAALGAKP